MCYYRRSDVLVVRCYFIIFPPHIVCSILSGWMLQFMINVLVVWRRVTLRMWRNDIFFSVIYIRASLGFWGWLEWIVVRTLADFA